MTKVFTAILLADMVEDGLVHVDDPVQRHLPDGVRMAVRSRAITLCDLATEPSGLPRLPPGLFRRSLRRRHDPYASFSERDLLNAVAETRLNSTPGERPRYSNFGFGLLGYVLARRSGMSYEELVRHRICTPLDLADIGIEVADDAHERFADGHNRRARSVPHWHLGALAGAGGLRSTVNDLLRFLGLQLAALASPLARAARATHRSRATRGRLQQGLGWVSLPLRGDTRRMLWHNGGTGGSAASLDSSPTLTLVSLCSPTAHDRWTRSASGSSNRSAANRSPPPQSRTSSLFQGAKHLLGKREPRSLRTTRHANDPSI